MNRVRFEGFRPGLFQFLSGLIENNNKPWFDEHRREYEAEVLGPIKSFVTELGPIIHMLNEDFETEPRVGRTISRINNDIRFHKNRPPYRPFIYIAFPQQGLKWSNSAVLYVAITAKGALHKKSAFCDVPKQSISTFCASAHSAQKVYLRQG
jgi:uncharacterized protein (TIGR02453 family)